MEGRHGRRNQSDDRQYASSRIAELAQQRERRLQALAARQQGALEYDVQADLHAAAQLPLPAGGGSNAARASCGPDAELQDDDVEPVIPQAAPPLTALTRLKRTGGQSPQHGGGVPPASGAARGRQLQPPMGIDDLVEGMRAAAIGGGGDDGGKGGGGVSSGGSDAEREGPEGYASGDDCTASDRGGGVGSGGGSSPQPAAGSGGGSHGRPAAGPGCGRAAARTDDAAGRAGDGSGCGGELLLQGGFRLASAVHNRLYAHQVGAVTWLWGLHRLRRGGILADDMGLGKTMTCAAFLAGVLGGGSGGGSGGGARRALVVAPKTLLAHWEAELGACGLRARVHCFYGTAEGGRAAALRALTLRGGVLLTTYGMVQHNTGQLRDGAGGGMRALGGESGAGSDSSEDEAVSAGRRPRLRWDWLILDEGHKIKNPHMQLSQRLRELRCVRRLVISGTPIQNNLMEMHALFDFVCEGLLGSAAEFKREYEKPILAGQDRHSTTRAREIGAAKAVELRRLVAPFMLRREKKDVLPGAGGGGAGSHAGDGVCDEGGAASAGASGGGADTAAGAASGSTRAGGEDGGDGGRPRPGRMGRKTDLVVWLRLQPLQQHIYEAFLNSDVVKSALTSSRSPLAALTVLKKVCDHPALLSERAARLVVSAGAKWAQQGEGAGGGGGRHNKPGGRRRNSLDDFIVDDGSSDGSGDGEADGSGQDRSWSGSSGESSDDGAAARKAALAESIAFSDAWVSWAGVGGGVEARLLSDLEQRGAEASCKTLLVMALLERLAAEGHRTLVFSQSRVMLDILQAATTARGLPLCRIDGTMGADARQAEVARFQRPGATIPVFLLTSQVGGLGLTLTAADRVVVVDPSWNPAQDNQSVDRAYRIGQARDVVVYRLVTCGTVEEKIYRKQVYKGGLSRTGTQEGVQFRYFTHQELHELFRVSPEGLVSSETQKLLEQLHGSSAPAATSPELAAHIAWLNRQDGCAGTSDHSLLFSSEDPDAPEVAGPRHPPAGAPASSELADLLAGMSLRGGAPTGASLPPLPPWQLRQPPPLLPASPHEQRVSQLTAGIADLHRQAAGLRGDLMLLGPRLPDGGAKLRARLDTLLAKLASQQQELQQLQASGDAQQPGAEGGAELSAADAASLGRLEVGGGDKSAPRSGSRGEGGGSGAAAPGTGGAAVGVDRMAGAADRSSGRGTVWSPQLLDITNGAGTGGVVPVPAGGVPLAGGLHKPPPTGGRLPGPEAHPGARRGPGQHDSSSRQPQPAAPQQQRQPPAPQQRQDEAAQQRQPPPPPPPPSLQQQRRQGGDGGAALTVAGLVPRLDELLLRKRVLKRELRELEGRLAGAVAGGDVGAAREARSAQRQMYEEYKAVKAALAPQGAGAAAAAAAPEVVDLTR